MEAHEDSLLSPITHTWYRSESEPTTILVAKVSGLEIQVDFKLSSLRRLRLPESSPARWGRSADMAGRDSDSELSSALDKRHGVQAINHCRLYKEVLTLRH